MRLEYKTYEEAKKNFKWSERWEVFDGNRERFNIAHECVSRHASEEIGIRIKFDDRRKEVYTFG
jgi:acetyl-CoA synthetase